MFKRKELIKLLELHKRITDYDQYYSSWNPNTGLVELCYADKLMYIRSLQPGFLESRQAIESDTLKPIRLVIDLNTFIRLLKTYTTTTISLRQENEYLIISSGPTETMFQGKDPSSEEVQNVITLINISS